MNSSAPFSSSVEFITPAMAAALLEQNTRNFRPMDRHKVDRFACEMTRGAWHNNGASIIIYSDGSISDGQHRLAAIVKSGIGLWLTVVRGVRTTLGIDRGTNRTMAQYLSSDGVKNASVVSAVSRMCVAHNKGLWADISWGSQDIVDSEIQEYAVANAEAINASIVHSRFCGLPKAVLTAVVFLGSGERDATSNLVCKWFIDSLRDGIGLGEFDAVTHFRRRLSEQRPGAKMSQYMTRMLLTLAWNKTAMGEKCSKHQLALRLTGPAPVQPPSRVIVADDNRGLLRPAI